MGPTWVLSAPDGPHVGPMNLAIRDLMVSGWCYREDTIRYLTKSGLKTVTTGDDYNTEYPAETQVKSKPRQNAIHDSF